MPHQRESAKVAPSKPEPLGPDGDGVLGDATASTG